MEKRRKNKIAKEQKEDHASYIEHIIVSELSQNSFIDLSTNIELNNYLKKYGIVADYNKLLEDLRLDKIFKVEGTKINLNLSGDFFNEE